jgi:WD40 repeat protein
MSEQPYIGLRPFERTETDIFFGRKQHRNELIDRLGSNHFLAVIGTSGSGKSSLVKTGLIAGLEAGYLAQASTHWRIVEMRPGNQPFKVLAENLFQELTDVLSPEYSAETLQQSLRQGSLSLHELLSNHPLPNNAQVLIVCDQFEEIFRFQQQSEAEARNFVSLLLDSSKPYPLSNNQVSHSMYVVITMRSDFLGDCAQFAGLAEAINEGLYLTPRLNTQQLRASIEEPAFMFGGEVEPELVVKLLEDAENNQDQLPLLQHALMIMWRLAEKAGSRQITMSLYNEIGGLENALSNNLDRIFNDLSLEQQKITEVMFCALTERVDTQRDTRRPVSCAEIVKLTGASFAEVVAVIDKFRKKWRCFLTPPVNVVLTEQSVIDISHESLIRQWRRLAEWTKKEAESAAIYKRLEQNALLHQEGKYGFYRTPELDFTLKWRDETKPTPQWASRYGEHFELAMALLAESQQRFEDFKRKQQEEIQQKTREQQRKIVIARIVTAVTGIGLLTMSGLAFWAWQERNRAEATEQQRVTELFESRITHASLLAKGEDYAGAKQILKETDALDKQVSPSLRHTRNLLASFTEIKGGEAQQVYRGAGYGLFTVAISPDGKLLAAGGEHGTLVLFDVQSGKLLQRLEGHAADNDVNIYSIAFTPSGQQLISSGADKKIIIWQRQQSNTTATDQTAVFKKQRELVAPAQVLAISISPDGKLLASGGYDNNITLWELGSGKKSRTFAQPGATNPYGLCFSPNSHYLASSFGYIATIWELETGKQLYNLAGHTDYVNNLKFSPDSSKLVTSSGDKTLRLWSVTTGEQQRVFNGHQNTVWTVSWFDDYLVSGSYDRSIRLWDSRSGVSLRVLQGHESGVQAFALYGGSLWSASNDGMVRRWSLSLPFQQARALLSEPTSSVITPNLNHIAIGFDNGDLSVYALSQTEPVWHKSSAHDDKIKRLTVSRHGRLLASGSFDNTAKIWQIAQAPKGYDLTELQTLSGHQDKIQALAFSPDAKTLATASYDGQIGLFTLDNPKTVKFIKDVHQGTIASVEFDNTGKQLLSSNFENRSLKLWNLQTNPPSSKNFPLANDSLAWSSISPDNQKLVSVGRGFVNVYGNNNSELLYHFTEHESTVYRAIFAPDSQELATVSADRTVKFWQLEQGKELFSLNLPTKAKDFNSSPVWDFDFRCLKEKCLLAVPLVRGQLQLYQLAYEGKLTADADETKRQQLEMWRLYLDTVDKLLQTNALQPAAQALHEAKEIGEKVRKLAPNDEEVQKQGKREQELEKKLNTFLKQDFQD